MSERVQLPPQGSASVAWMGILMTGATAVKFVAVPRGGSVEKVLKKLLGLDDDGPGASVGGSGGDVGAEHFVGDLFSALKWGAVATVIVSLLVLALRSRPKAA